MTNLFIEFLKLLIRILIRIIFLPRLIIRKYFDNKNANKQNANNVNNINTNNINVNKSERKGKRNKYGFPII